MNLPKNIRINKTIPKTKFYENIKLDNKSKEEFVQKIEKIIWEYKLSESTINTKCTDLVTEIQIFNVFLKEKYIPTKIITTITNTIQTKILFKVIYEDEYFYCSFFEGVLYKTNWNEVINFDFSSSNLERLYQKIIKYIIKEESNNDDFYNILLNKKRVYELEGLVNSLTTKVNKEKQFNRKVELNKQLNECKKELEQLKG